MTKNKTLLHPKHTKSCWVCMIAVCFENCQFFMPHSVLMKHPSKTIQHINTFRTQSVFSWNRFFFSIISIRANKNEKITNKKRIFGCSFFCHRFVKINVITSCNLHIQKYKKFLYERIRNKTFSIGGFFCFFCCICIHQTKSLWTCFWTI